VGLVLELGDVLAIRQLLAQQRRRQRIEQGLRVTERSQAWPEAVQNLRGAVVQPDELVDAGQLDQLLRRYASASVCCFGAARSRT
jgi:hypothetical protein